MAFSVHVVLFLFFSRCTFDLTTFSCLWCFGQQYCCVPFYVCFFFLLLPYRLILPFSVSLFFFYRNWFIFFLALSAGPADVRVHLSQHGVFRERDTRTAPLRTGGGFRTQGRVGIFLRASVCRWKSRIFFFFLYTSLFCVPLVGCFMMCTNTIS